MGSMTAKYLPCSRTWRRSGGGCRRWITELECRATATRLLARGTAGLLTELLPVDVGEAKAQVRAAGVLGARTSITGEPLDPVYSATAAAQAAGTISEKHARIVTTTIGALPHHLDGDTVASAERTLVTEAEGLRPSDRTRHDQQPHCTRKLTSADRGPHCADADE